MASKNSRASVLENIFMFCSCVSIFLTTPSAPLLKRASVRKVPEQYSSFEGSQTTGWDKTMFV